MPVPLIALIVTVAFAALSQICGVKLCPVILGPGSSIMLTVLASSQLFVSRTTIL